MSNERFTLRTAVYLMLIKDGKMLFLRRFNTGWQDGKYSLIAGHIDRDETIAQAMVAEVREEAGINLESKDLRVVHTMHRKSGNIEYVDFFLIVDLWAREPRIMERNKCDEMKWFPLNKLLHNLIPHVKKAIEYYHKKVYFSEYGWEPYNTTPIPSRCRHMRI